MAALHLFAAPVAGASGVDFFSPVLAYKLRPIRHFVCERIRTTRRLLRDTKLFPNLEELQFTEMGKHSTHDPLTQATTWLKEGYHVAFFSEAGAPVIADPGANLVALCHKNNIPVIPCLSDSAILSAIVASGFKAQAFSFHGYLPIHAQGAQKAIHSIERKMYQEKNTHIFMETPFRTQRLFTQLLKELNTHTYLCVASQLHTPQARVQTKAISEWKKIALQLHKKPTVFLIGRLAIC